MREFVLTLEVDDELDTDLPALLVEARRLRALIGLQAVRFWFDGIRYTVTNNRTIQRINSEVDEIFPEAVPIAEAILAIKRGRDSIEAHRQWI